MIGLPLSIAGTEKDHFVLSASHPLLIYSGSRPIVLGTPPSTFSPQPAKVDLLQRCCTDTLVADNSFNFIVETVCVHCCQSHALLLALAVPNRWRSRLHRNRAPYPDALAITMQAQPPIKSEVRLQE